MGGGQPQKQVGTSLAAFETRKDPGAEKRHRGGGVVENSKSASRPEECVCMCNVGSMSCLALPACDEGT